jgi:hypothetical protein
VSSWAEAQKQQTENFSRRLDDSWAATHDFWKHLVVVEATVLGLTVGLLGGRDEAPAITVVLSWVFLLLAIAVGCVLVKIAIDVTIDGAIRGYRGAADIAGIMAQVEAGELDPKSDDYRGLFVAAMFQSAPNEAARAAFSPLARGLVEKYVGRLPTSSFLNMPKRSGSEKWLHAHWQGIAQLFYALSFVAFVLLLASVGPWAFRPASESAVPAAISGIRRAGPNQPPMNAGFLADSSEGSHTKQAPERADSPHATGQRARRQSSEPRRIGSSADTTEHERQR